MTIRVKEIIRLENLIKKATEKDEVEGIKNYIEILKETEKQPDVFTISSITFEDETKSGQGIDSLFSSENGVSPTRKMFILAHSLAGEIYESPFIKPNMKPIILSMLNQIACLDYDLYDLKEELKKHESKKESEK